MHVKPDTISLYQQEIDRSVDQTRKPSNILAVELEL